MKGIYKLGAVVLVLLVLTTTASAFTEIGDNITVANNITARNFLGNLSWAYLLGIPADFSNSTVAGYNGNFPNSTIAGYGSNFPNTSLPNYLLISTYGGNFPNQTLTNLNGNYPNSTVLTREPTIAGSTNNVFWNGLKQWISLAAANISDFTASARSSISSSSGLVSYNSTTGVVSDSINSSANLYNLNGSNITTGTIPTARYLNAVNSSALLASISQVTGLQGNLDTLNTTKANKTDIGEFTGGQLSTARLPAGTVILIDANETESSDITSTGTSAEITLMTFNLPANSYSRIIVEAEVGARQNVNKALGTSFRWRFNESTIIRKEFVWALTNINTLGSQSAGNATIKTSFPGGQAVTTTLNLTGQIFYNPAAISVTMDARSFRVYGVI